jgi:hypothetical protein
VECPVLVVFMPVGAVDVAVRLMILHRVIVEAVVPGLLHWTAEHGPSASMDATTVKDASLHHWREVDETMAGW